MLGRLVLALGPDLGRRAGEDHSLCRGWRGAAQSMVSAQSMVCCRQQCLVLDPMAVRGDRQMSTGESGHLRVYLGTARSAKVGTKWCPPTKLAESNKLCLGICRPLTGWRAALSTHTGWCCGPSTARLQGTAQGTRSGHWHCTSVAEGTASIQDTSCGGTQGTTQYTGSPGWI